MRKRLCVLRNDRDQLNLMGRVLGLFQERPDTFFAQLADISEDIDDSQDRRI